MVYLLIDALAKEHPIRVSCNVLGVSFSSFYSWKHQETFSLNDKKKARSEKIKEVLEDHKSRYGALRISSDLKSQGEKNRPKLTQTLVKSQNL